MNRRWLLSACALAVLSVSLGVAGALQQEWHTRPDRWTSPRVCYIFHVEKEQMVYREMVHDGDGCKRTSIRIIAVNHMEELQQPPAKGKILFSCRADGQRIEAQADGRGGVSLQLWKPGRARALQSPPRSFPVASAGLLSSV